MSDTSCAYNLRLMLCAWTFCYAVCHSIYIWQVPMLLWNRSIDLKLLRDSNPIDGTSIRIIVKYCLTSLSMNSFKTEQIYTPNRFVPSISCKLYFLLCGFFSSYRFYSLQIKIIIIILVRIIFAIWWRLICCRNLMSVVDFNRDR